MRLDPTGEQGPTPRQARGRSWRRSSHGLYVPSDVPLTAPQRIVEAAALLPADRGAVTGWAALHWAGADWIDEDELPVPVVVPDHYVDPRPGIVISEERLIPDRRIFVDELPLTDHRRSVAYELRYARGLWAAVKAFDLALASDLVSRVEMAPLAYLLNAWTGVQMLRDALVLSDENVWSPMETEMRLHWRLGLGLPRPLCNHPVFDLDGRFIGTPDLLDVEAGVVGEYDGELHLEGSQRAVDINREAAFRRVGLEYVTMTAADRYDPTAFYRRTTEARQRALATAARSRRWTAVPPPWWTPTVTVEQRRALSQWERERYLRRRAG